MQNNSLKGKYIDKLSGRIYLFKAAWLSHTSQATPKENLIEGIYPKAITSNISNSLIPIECGIKQPIATFSFIPTYSQEGSQPLSNYIASITLNRNSSSTDMKTPASGLTAKINFADHQLDFVDSDLLGSCKFSKGGVTCGNCNFAPLNTEVLDHFAGSSDRLPLADEEANLNSSASKGSYFGYAHIESIDAYQPLRLKIDPVNNSVVITKFFGNPDDSEYIIHKLSSADSKFRRSSLVHGDADNFAQFSWATRNLVTGIIYSKSTGRIGRFAAHKKGLTLGPSAKKVGKIGGHFVSTNNHLELMVTPGVSIAADSRSPLGIKAILKSSDLTQPTMMEGGYLDLGHQLLYLNHPTEGPLTLSIAGRDMKIADAKLKRQNKRSRTAKANRKKSSTLH